MNVLKKGEGLHGDPSIFHTNSCRPMSRSKGKSVVRKNPSCMFIYIYIYIYNIYIYIYVCMYKTLIVLKIPDYTICN